MRTPLKLLALCIATTSTALVLLVTGVLPNNTLYTAQVRLPNISRHTQSAQSAFQTPSTDQQGEVLGSATGSVKPQQVKAAGQFVTLLQLNQALDKYTKFLASFGLPPGASRTDLLSSAPAQTNSSGGITGLVSNGNGQTTSLIGGNPIVTYVPSVPSSNFSGTSMAGFGSLSAGTFTSGNTTIGGNLNVSGPVFAGSLTSSGDVSIAGALSAATSTLSALIVSGPATFSGSTTIAGLTVLSLNPGLTQGSITFQGVSGLSEDNANLFYDAVDHHFSIGTTAPTSVLFVQGTSTTPLLNVVASSSVSALYVSNLGNVGIGTTGPTSLLQVQGTSVNQFRLGYDGTNYSTWGVDGGGGLTLTTNGTAASYNVTLGSGGNYGINNGALFFNSANRSLALNNTGSASQFEVAVPSGTQVNAIPTMTSDIAPSGVASASSEALYPAWQGFDGLITTPYFWAVSGSTGWLAYQFPSTKIIVKYRINVATNPTRAPSSWTFEGWNGSSWVVLDTRSGVTGWNGWNDYIFTNTTAYIKYRINITANNGDVSYLQINEMQMMEGTSYTPAFDVATNGNVGIGTVNPSTALEIDNSTNSALRFSSITDGSYYTSINNNYSYGNPMTITNGRFGGNVVLGVYAATSLSLAATNTAVNIGIGTTTPSATLDIVRSGGGGSIQNILFARLADIATRFRFVIDDASVDNMYQSFIINANSPYSGFTKDISNYGAAGIAFNPAASDNVSGTGILFNVAGAATTTFQTAMIVQQGGNVGIGTTSPTATLYIQGTGAVNPFTVVSSTGASLLTVLPNGNVGVGTTIPASLLTLRGTTSTISLLNIASSSGSSVFFVANSGNVGIGTSTPMLGPLTMASGAYVTTGGTWTNASDRNLKENFATVTPADILQKIDQLPVTEWNYKSEGPVVKHIGPVAQDFYSIFQVGNSSTSISTIDPSGIALLGIQALDQKIAALQGALTGNLAATNLSVYIPDNFSGDSVGEAKILAGQTRVRVSFLQPYNQLPIVTFSPEGAAFAAFIQEKDSGGFTLALTAATTTDAMFDWHSFASPREMLTVSDGTTQPVVKVSGSSPDDEAIVSSAVPAVFGTSTPANSDPPATSTPPAQTVLSSLEAASTSQLDISPAGASVVQPQTAPAPRPPLTVVAAPDDTAADPISAVPQAAAPSPSVDP